VQVKDPRIFIYPLGDTSSPVLPRKFSPSRDFVAHTYVHNHLFCCTIYSFYFCFIFFLSAL